MAGKWKARWLSVGLVLGIGTFASGEPAVPEGTAALAEFIRKVPLEDGEHVVGMTGFHAGPRPLNWLILIEPASAEGSYRELVFDGATVLARRLLAPLPGQQFPTLPIDLDLLRVPSDEACRIGTEQARLRGAVVHSTHIQLRIREEGNEPVWMLKLLGPARSEVGTVYVSAQTGEVLRQSWAEGRGSERDKVSAR
jgi:hypothetical protein